jgi:DNA polymerase-3 subunit epsilon
MLTFSPQQCIVALDLETTGLSAERDRIVELAAVRWQNGKEIGHFQTLVNPGFPIPSRVIKVHGITDDMVKDAPVIGDVLPAFLQFCEADLVVAHNSPFDVRFLNAECRRQRILFFSSPVADTCSLAKQRLTSCPNYKLETLKAALGLGKGQAHRALDDARDCLQLYLHCIQQQLPKLHLPIDPPPLREELRPLCDALKSGTTVTIEYRDVRGRVTCREIRPLFIDESNVQAFCLLRQDKRHFALERIISVSPH